MSPSFYSNTMMTNTWKCFRYDEIFQIRKGFYNKKPEAVPHGDIPFIGATDFNNGVTSWHTLDEIEVASKDGSEKNQPLESKIFDGNCICVTNNGSVGYAYYQEAKFTCSHDVNPLYPNPNLGWKMNKYNALFLCGVIEQDRFRWAYGRKWRPERMAKSVIKLPVTTDGKPDWQFMEDYVKRIFPSMPRTENAPQIAVNKDSGWRRFVVSDLFDVLLPKGDLKEGFCVQDVRETQNTLPLISATSTNNGVVGLIDGSGDEKAVAFPGNVLTVDMFCNAYYQLKPFYAVGHGRVNVLIPKFKMNLYQALYLCTVLNNEKYRFSYGRAVYSGVLKNLEIYLPVDANGNVDQCFMEDCIKSLPMGDCL